MGNSTQAAPRISVIMAFLNAERFIREAIESVLAQTGTGLELLLIDDGSTDGSPAIAQGYADRYPGKIRYLQDPERRTRGASAARNLGLAHARGEYVAILDADDIAERQRFAKQLAYLDAHPEVALLGSWYTEIDSAGRRMRLSWKPCADLDIRWALLFYSPFLHSSVMFRKRPVLERVGGYDEALPTWEDHDLWRRIAQFFVMANLPESLVRYRLHEDSLTATQGRRSQRATGLRVLPAAQLLGWDDRDAEQNRRRLKAMTALLLGWGNDLAPEELARASEEIFRLHAAFCEKERIGREAAERHRARLRRLVSHNLVVLARPSAAGGPAASRSLLARAYRLHPQTFLRPGILLRSSRLLGEARFRGVAGTLRHRAGEEADTVRERLFPRRVRHVSGLSEIAAGPEELVVVCLVRDGAVYLDAFLQHYRALGAKHLVLLDNGSTDGTVERATRQPDVTVLKTRAPYRHYKVIAKRYLVRRFGRSSWVLCVDIDEFFDYPYRDRLTLREFLQYLNSHGYTAVVAQLLDLFPRGELSTAATDLRVEHRYYDVSAIQRQPYRERYGNLNQRSNERIAVHIGGVRSLHFGVRPMLTKHSLQFPAGGAHFMNSHKVSRARVADISAVLLHYKYVSGFLHYAERIVRERSFHEQSAEYRSYLEVLRQNPSLSLYTEDATELRHPDQLVEEGFLVVSDAYAARAGAVEADRGAARGSRSEL